MVQQLLGMKHVCFESVTCCFTVPSSFRVIVVTVFYADFFMSYSFLLSPCAAAHYFNFYKFLNTQLSEMLRSSWAVMSDCKCHPEVWQLSGDEFFARLS